MSDKDYSYAGSRFKRGSDSHKEWNCGDCGRDTVVEEIYRTTCCFDDVVPSIYYRCESCGFNTWTYLSDLTLIEQKKTIAAEPEGPKTMCQIMAEFL